MASPLAVYGLGDVGATESRLTLMTQEGIVVGEPYTRSTDPLNYGKSIERVVDMAQQGEHEHGVQIVAGSLAIAGTPDETGTLVMAGDLRRWIGEKPGADMAKGLGLAPEEVGALNDVVAIALSQQAINERNRRRTDGTAATLSTGFNVANYYADGKLEGDEAGHVFLREGADCACDSDGGEEGHVEAYFSGLGRERNNGGMKLRDWLLLPGNEDEFVEDGATALVQLLDRHREERGFVAQEFAWTGSVALRQPFMMNRIAERVQDEMRERFGPTHIPAFVMATMLDRAGLHGTFVDASRRAELV